MNVSFFGRLTRDAEIKTGKSGANFTAFTVATNVRAKGNDGKAKAVFVDVTAFGKTGETICQYFHKGSRSSSMARCRTSRHGKARTTAVCTRMSM
mgnify:FL=1